MIETLDIGANIRRRRSRHWWVSKSDVVQYLKCPYRVHLSHIDGIPYGDFATPEFKRLLLEPGQRFEAQLLESWPLEKEAPLEFTTDLRSASTRDVFIRGDVLIRNHDLGIQGIPDLVRSKKGIFIPIEIKNHRDVRISDRLELAFYWKVLEPLRGRRSKSQGLLLLNDGSVNLIDLGAADFDNLEKLIEDVRRVKKHGASPVLSGECKVCQYKDEHLGQIRELHGLSLLHDVGLVRDGQLRILGIQTMEDLVKADPLALYARWRLESPSCPSVRQIEAMQVHAEAWLEGSPKAIGNERIPSRRRSIVLDLEYDPLGLIFTVGVLLIDAKGKSSVQQGFLDDHADPKPILQEFGELLRKFPDYKVVTWGGLSADLPMLRTAWKRHRLSKRVLASLEERHVDLYQLSVRNFRLPFPTMRLSELAPYLGFERSHPSIGGLEMPALYGEFTRARKAAKRAQIKSDILGHNRDDLYALFHVWDEIRVIRDSTKV